MITAAAIATINRKVGMEADGQEIMDLAKRVGMQDIVNSHPITVAKEITRYLDDLARDP